jgi:hypothetical protein
MQKKPTILLQHGNSASWNTILMLEETKSATIEGTKLNLMSISFAQARKFQSQ